VSKETYYRVNVASSVVSCVVLRDILCQKRPTTVSKETYYRVNVASSVVSCVVLR